MLTSLLVQLHFRSMVAAQHEGAIVTSEDAFMGMMCVDLNELWAAAVPINEGVAEGSSVAVLASGTSASAVPHSSPPRCSSVETVLHDGDCELPVESDRVAVPASFDYDEENLKRSTQNVPDAIELGKRNTVSKLVAHIKYAYSGFLLLFCITVVTAAIFGRQTTATGDYNTRPIVAFLVFWFLILWLALMEGGLNCMVGLKPIERARYDATHRLAAMCTALAHKGDNLERFIVGRQFLDLTCVFLTNFMVSSIDSASVLGMPAVTNDIFLAAGVAVILVTIVIGQLISQINAAHCMLDFINNRVMVVTTYAALAIEGSGLLHAVYLFQILVAKLTGNTIKSSEPEKTVLAKTWFWSRVLMSTLLLLFSFVVTIKALFAGSTTMWNGVPAYISVISLAVLILVVGNMEALQIAMLAVVHLPEDTLKQYPVAQRNCNLTFKGSNLQAFLVGRQIFQTILMFVIARITTLDVADDTENIFGVNDGIQKVFNAGFLGALISTICASLSWRVIASTFPIAFLRSPFANPTIRFCLLVENTGVCSVAWLLAAVHKRLARLRPDEDYVGTAEERSGNMDASATKRIEEGFTASESSQRSDC